MPGESTHRSVPNDKHHEQEAEETGLPGPDITRHPSTDSTPSDSGSSPNDSGSTPSPSTPQKLLPTCTSPFGPRLFHATSSNSATPRPQPEGSDYRNSSPRLSGKLGGHGPCGRHVPLKMERIKVLTGSEVESDYKEPQTIDTRVVMGEETLLKTDIQKEKTLVELSGQTMTAPSSSGFSESQSHAAEIQTENNKQGTTVQTLQKQQGTQKDTGQSPNRVPSPFDMPVCSSFPQQPVTNEKVLMDNQDEGQTDSHDEVPSLSLPELPCPVELSFSEPACAVDPLRVGVPTSLDPDLYYTAPSTPIKMASCSSHLKHHSYPGSPAYLGSPSDSEDLCSPLTSPSGSYITAEGGSWTSSYTSSTSPSTSPNLLLIDEAQEAPACFVGSLSEIGDEVAEEKGRGGAEQEEVKPEDFCVTEEDCVMSSQMGVTERAILEKEEVLNREEIKLSRESCRPHWVTEDVSSLRSSSSRSSDSQEDGGGSESSLYTMEEAIEGSLECSRPIQSGLNLQLGACVPEEHYGQIDDHSELASTSLTPDIDNLSMASTSLGPDSPITPMDIFCRGAFDRLGQGSFVFSQGTCVDDIPEEERMIPASLISFPLHTSLIFKADSMDITLFPAEEEDEKEREANNENDGKDVDAYAAGEEEADVEDDDDDDIDDDDDDFDGDGDGDVDNAYADDEGGIEVAGKETKVEVQVIEEEEQEEDDEDCDSNTVEDLTDEDSSASFLHSLSDTSINEGLDESFCFEDDTDDSLESASYNGDEDERLYSTERHAQALEPTQVDAPTLAEIRTESDQGPPLGIDQTQHLDMHLSTDHPQTPSPSEVSAALPKGSHVELEAVGAPDISELQSDLLQSGSQTEQAGPLGIQLRSDKPIDDQEVPCFAESVSGQLEVGPTSRIDISGLSNPPGHPKDNPDFNAPTAPLGIHAAVCPTSEIHTADPSTTFSNATGETKDIDNLVVLEEIKPGIVEENTHQKDVDVKESKSPD
ncbi:uncharacterized protein LOC117513483 [Thalassophryne amazonica]|uniref:uncharacterized protein LOC117513483 n=1 Tax=Thalassophryne amazonica TaxID=390379 RepID=UPI001470B0F0|nr:uncharacterized protein LOC117513483 [Thalassophryne amazonica]